MTVSYEGEQQLVLTNFTLVTQNTILILHLPREVLVNK